MEITQAQLTALEEWVEYKKDAYYRKGFSLAAKAGVESLADFEAGEGIPLEEAEKSLTELKAELQQAEVFYSDARQLLFAGRQGG